MSTELHWLTSLSLYLKGSFSIGGDEEKLLIQLEYISLL